MNVLRLGTRYASMVWLEPNRVHAGGHARPIQGPLTQDSLVPALEGLPPGPSRWVVDDAWMPALLLRDIVEVPPGAEARDGFFKWRYSQSLALEAPQIVQSLSLGENAWLLLGMDEALREAWLLASLSLGRPIRSLLPRWLWLYNKIAPSQEAPGMLLSLCQAGPGSYTGTLAAWGRNLTLLRQWTEPATPEDWLQERILPSTAYLHRESKSPQEILIWGAGVWPEGPVRSRFLPFDIPAQEEL